MMAYGKQMKGLNLVRALGLMSALAASSFGQAGQQPFALAVSAGEVYKAGSNIYVTITQTNTSDHPMMCGAYVVGSSNLSFDYLIKDENGNKLPIRPGVYQMPGSYQTCGELAPGERTSAEYWISWLYDLSSPGSYTIQISRRTGDNKHPIVKSNIASFKVIDRNSEN